MRDSGLISIRSYQPQDLPVVIALFLGAVREIAARDYTPAQIEAWARADPEKWASRRLSRPTWVAVMDHVPVGFTDMEPDGRLDMMYVHPACQNKGIASALLETVEAAARRQGMARILTEASITAKPFFEKRGFRVVRQQSVEISGQLLTNFRMEKILSS